MIKKMSFILSIVILLTVMTYQCFGVELVRQKNVATKILVPIVDADGDTVTAAAELDSEFTYWTDGASAVNWTDLTGEMTELQESGWYELDVSQSEMNHDYIAIQTKTSTSGAKTQNILIRTIVGDPLNLATTDDGGTINVTTGKIDEVATLTGHTAQTGDAYARLGAPAGASVSADVAAIKSDTGAILTDTAAMDSSGELRTLLFGSDTAGATAANQTTIIGYIDTEVAAILSDTNELQTNQGNWLTATGFSTHSAADVVSAMQAVASDFKADVSGLATAVNLATVDTVVDAIKAKTDNLPSDPADASVIAGLIATAQADLDNPDQYKATGFSTHSAADVWAVATRALTDKAGFSLSDAGIDAIWDEVQSGHATAGSFGLYLDAQVSTVGGGTAADIADAVWEEAIADHSGTSGSTAEALTNASSAGNPWSTDISTGYDGQAGEYLRNVKNATDGDKESGSYTGIETMIRSNR